METENSHQDELIIAHMNHELYVSVVDYIESLDNQPEKREKPLRIKGIDKINSANPPSYDGVHIGIEGYGFAEARENASKAIQGLAKIIFGELSLPEGMRK